MPGADLTNQIVGVLLQFWQKRVPFGADIEAMLYLVRIPPKQRSNLKLLWCKNSNTREEIIDLEISALVFDVTLSPTCSNCTLRLTAAVNERQFGSEASDTLRRNVYVDDLLKSVKTVTIVSNVTGMCAASGFNLTKFTSNKKEVRMAIPDAKRCKGLKNQDFVSGAFRQEGALGIN